MICYRMIVGLLLVCFEFMYLDCVVLLRVALPISLACRVVMCCLMLICVVYCLMRCACSCVVRCSILVLLLMIVCCAVVVVRCYVAFCVELYCYVML